MNQSTVSINKFPCKMSVLRLSQVRLNNLKVFKTSKACNVLAFSHVHTRRFPVCCTTLPQWEPSPVTYASTEDASGKFLEKSTNIFESLTSKDTVEKATSKTEELRDTSNEQLRQLQFLKWPMWLLGPSLLLATGMVPTLWLPISSIFLGPDIVSLLSLIGLDCIFNLGATLFLLMADSCARPKNSSEACISKPPFSYKFWNIFATMAGFVIPLVILFASHQGLLQPHLPLISSAVLLAPYLILLSVQILTEILTWHWQSPVWLVTPVVYEAYRVLQLMRGLKLGTELSAPAWMVHTIRGLVSWWVLILGMQLMRVAWFAGFTARARKQQTSASASD